MSVADWGAAVAGRRICEVLCFDGISLSHCGYLVYKTKRTYIFKIKHFRLLYTVIYDPVFHDRQTPDM
jgi:hypothetical protein